MAIAGVVAAVALLALSWPWRAPHPARVALGWTLGVAAALIVGDLALGLELRWPPKEDRHRFLLLVLPAVAVVESVAAFPKVSRWIAWLLRAVVAAGVGRVLLHGSVYLTDLSGPDSAQWPTAEMFQYLGGLAAALLAVWALLGLLLHIAPSRSMPLALAVACAGAAVTVMFSGSATDGQLGLPLAAALTGATVASFMSPTPRGAAPISIGVVGLFALLIGGHFFAELTCLHAGLLFAAPLLCWATALPPLRKLPPWLRGCLCLLLVAVPVTLAAYQAKKQSEENSRPPTGEGEDYEDYYRQLLR
jgi:hypothetical protein